jgi:hypothetical protein
VRGEALLGGAPARLGLGESAVRVVETLGEDVEVAAQRPRPAVSAARIVRDDPGDAAAGEEPGERPRQDRGEARVGYGFASAAESKR